MGESSHWIGHDMSPDRWGYNQPMTTSRRPRTRRTSSGLGATLAGLLAITVCSVARPTASADQARHVTENVLISPGLPPLAIRVDPAFSYLGVHPIRIRDVAGGERHVFVDAEGGKAKRLVVMQFEGFLRGVDGQYRYDLSSSPVVAGFPFRSNGFAFDMDQSLRENPSGEAAATHAFLTARGLEVPRHWMMWRSLTVADPERRHELIIFYVEDAQSHDLTIDDLYQGDQETEAWSRLQRQLETAANQSFELAPLDDDGKPRRGSWASIPTRPMH